MHRTWGGISSAGTYVPVPGLCFRSVCRGSYIAFGDTALVAGLFYGIKPAPQRFVVQAVHRIGLALGALRGGVCGPLPQRPSYQSRAECCHSRISSLRRPDRAISATIAPDKFRTGGALPLADKSMPGAWIDDEPEPRPRSAGRLLRVAIAGVCCG